MQVRVWTEVEGAFQTTWTVRVIIWYHLKSLPGYISDRGSNIHNPHVIELNMIEEGVMTAKFLALMKVDVHLDKITQEAVAHFRNGKKSVQNKS